MAYQVHAKDLDGKTHKEHWTNDFKAVERVLRQLEDDPQVTEAWYEEEK